MAKTAKALREIDKPIYRYWQALYHSFFNPRLYVDVCKRWQGYGVLYLLLLMFVATIPFSVRVALNFNQFFDEALVKPLQQLPIIYIQNGNVSLNQPIPYLIKNASHQIVAIVDTSGAVNAITEAYPYLNILITKDKLYYRFPSPRFFYDTQNAPHDAQPIYIYPFSKESNSIFVGKDWVNTSGIMNLKMFFTFIIYPTIALVFFAVFLVIFLAFSLMGQFIARLFHITISYKQACREVMVSATPFVVILWIMFCFGIITGRYNFIMPLIFILYYCYAMIALKRESRKLVLR